MIRLLIIADDFTGALDTGVKFAEKGAEVRVIVGDSYEFEKADPQVSVLVVDAETRHLNGKDAYEKVACLVKKARDAKIPYIYKKTDSALRGNIGSELTAVLEAGKGMVLPFVPAFPKMGRTTERGIHYIDGVPVSESVFGKDPFEPVERSEVAALIGKQSSVAVCSIEDRKILKETETPVIAVYDAKTDEELRSLAVALKETGQLSVTAGCAGMAEMLPELLELELCGKEKQNASLFHSLLVVCGSVNPITRRQIEAAKTYGFTYFRLTPEEKLEPGYFDTPEEKQKVRDLAELIKNEAFCILDTNDPDGGHETADHAKSRGISRETMRKRIPENLGHLVRELIHNGVEATMLITGGDALLGIMEEMSVSEMVPVEEVMPGTVLSRFAMEGRQYQVISKSGGFGEEDLFVKLAKMIRAGEEKNVC